MGGSTWRTMVVGGRAPSGRTGRPGASVALVALVALVGACGTTAAAPATQADTAFLSSVHGAAPDVGSYRQDQSLIRLGHASCDGFKAGASYQQLADRLALQEGTHALPSDDLGAVITAAVGSYCPQYAGLVG